MLSPTTDALELHIARANYQVGIWIKSEVAILDTKDRPLDTNQWQDGTDGLENVWKWLRTVPDACIELTSCRCKTKCKFTRCKCFKVLLECISTCGCDGVNCIYPMDDKLYEL